MAKKGVFICGLFVAIITVCDASDKSKQMINKNIDELGLLSVNWIVYEDSFLFADRGGIKNHRESHFQNIVLVSNSSIQDKIGNSSRTNYQTINQLSVDLNKSISLQVSASDRHKNYVSYNKNRGYLVAYGYENYQLDELSLWQNTTNVNWVIGNYDLGIGSGLTITTRYNRFFSGISITSSYKLNYLYGTIIEKPQLKGMAIDYKKKLSGIGIKLLLFSSRQKINLNNFQLDYGPDEWSQLLVGNCTSENSRHGNFTCDATGKWHSHYIGVEGNTTTSLKYAVLEDVIEENIFGQYIELSRHKHRMGFVNYFTTSKLNISAPDVQISSRSKYQGVNRLMLSGLYYQYHGSYRLDAEISRSSYGGVALYTKLVKPLNNRWKLSSSFQHFDENYINPYTNLRRYEKFRDKNHFYTRQQSAMLNLSGRFSTFNTLSHISLSRNSRKRGSSSEYDNLDLKLSQMLQQGLNHRWRIRYQAILDNKDIFVNGRKYTYRLKDQYQKGERREVSLTLINKSDKNQHMLNYLMRWEDVKQYSDHFEKAQIFRYQVQSTFKKFTLAAMLDYRLKYIPIESPYIRSLHNYKYRSSVNMAVNKRGSYEFSIRMDYALHQNEKDYSFVTTAQLSMNM